VRRKRRQARRPTIATPAPNTDNPAHHGQRPLSPRESKVFNVKVDVLAHISLDGGLVLSVMDGRDQHFGGRFQYGSQLAKRPRGAAFRGASA
jgi:hypothetical protein